MTPRAGSASPRGTGRGVPREPARPRPRAAARLRVNPITCDAHGMCAELLPERIHLDEWGYPVLAEGPLEADLLALARQAAKACPTRALLLEEPRRGGG